MTFPDPVKGRAVWTAAELAADNNWIHTLRQSECAEVFEATKAVMAQGLDSEGFGRSDFPLPGLASLLDGLAQELYEGRGCILIRGLPIDDYDETGLQAAYWGIAAHFGEAISQNSKGQRLAAVTDHGNDISRGNTRGYTTSAALYPHSDMCQMTGLLCVQPAVEGGESQVVSSLSIYNYIWATKPEHLETLFQGFHHDLRGEGAKGQKPRSTKSPTTAFPFSANAMDGFPAALIQKSVSTAKPNAAHRSQRKKLRRWSMLAK